MMGHSHRTAPAGVGGRPSKAPASWTSKLLWLVVLLLGQAIASVAAQDGPGGRPCTLSLAAAAKPRSTKPGRALTLTVTWMNQARAGLADGVLQMQLPPRVAFVKGAASANAGRGGLRKPAYDPDRNTVTWARLAVRANARLKFKVRAKVPKCYPGPQLAFKTTAYVLDPNAGESTPLCVEENTVIVVGGWGWVHHYMS